jgi:hypothetical protein
VNWNDFEWPWTYKKYNGRHELPHGQPKILGESTPPPWFAARHHRVDGCFKFCYKNVSP